MNIMPKIILTSLNARYIHCALGLRYLRANMGTLLDETVIQEYIVNSRPIDIAEDLLSTQADIIGFGVYIWNLEQTCQVIKLIKTIRPEVTIIIGGPEVSYEFELEEIVKQSDYLITGQADLVFADLCQRIIAGHLPNDKVIQAPVPTLNAIQLPYAQYTDEDIRNRVIYVEASRGCPFKCEFCLSALDKTAWPFDIELFLQAMQELYLRGARHFKFVDRTFNLKIDSSLRIMQFFLDKMGENKLFLHFELIPDHLPEKLKEMIARFPPQSLQFEIGIQSMDPEVQKRISRKQDAERTMNNLCWLRDHSHAHIHADLIVGLPGEDIKTFARGFNQLASMHVHEIQVGILKRLKGTPIIRHTEAYGLRFNPDPPYNILCNDLINFENMQRMVRFARYWDMIANSGRFSSSIELILGTTAFENFMRLSDWLYQQTAQTHKFSLERLFGLVYTAMTEILSVDKELATQYILRDFNRSGIKGAPKFLYGKQNTVGKRSANPAQRQQQHTR